MKAFPFLLATCLLVALTVRADAPTPSKEDLGYDVFEGKTNKIDRIVHTDPRFIWVVYENDSGSRRIPRSELPPQLKDRYPFDPKKAADYVNEKALEAEHARSGTVALQKETLFLRERNLIAQITQLKSQQKENDNQIASVTKEISAATKKKKDSFRTRKIDLLKKQESLKNQMDKLQASLKETRSQLDALP